MRERIAVGVAVLAVALLLVLSGVFARIQNPPVADLPDSPPAGVGTQPAVEAPPRTGVQPGIEAAEEAAPPPAAQVALADSLRGRALYDSAGCARCHSVAGVGSPRYPLDGVGARRPPAQLRAWTVGAEALADSLPPATWRAKQAFQAMRPENLDALVAYLGSLRGAD
jgi:cytochrome c553